MKFFPADYLLAEAKVAPPVQSDLAMTAFVVAKDSCNRTRAFIRKFGGLEYQNLQFGLSDMILFGGAISFFFWCHLIVLRFHVCVVRQEHWMAVWIIRNASVWWCHLIILWCHVFARGNVCRIVFSAPQSSATSRTCASE